MTALSRARFALSLWVLTFAAAGFVPTAQAQFDLSWWTIDGGGGMFSTGGGFELGGTIGQPDAGRMTGGGFELVGGFWAVAAPAAPAACPGDLNCDGVVNFTDIDLFVEALSYPGGAGWPYPNCPWLNGDANGDNNVTFGDIDPFVALIGTNCP